MGNTSNIEPVAKRDLHYYRRRFLNRVHSSLASFFAHEAENHGATKALIAKKLEIDPSQVTRWLAHPSNMTLESISDILLALDAEAEPLEIISFRERAKPNYAHPLVAKATGSEGTRRLHSFTSGEETFLQEKSQRVEKMVLTTSAA